MVDLKESADELGYRGNESICSKIDLAISGEGG
jgi:hypothetical protein